MKCARVASMIATTYSPNSGLPTATVVFIIIMYLKYFVRIKTSVCLSVYNILENSGNRVGK